jgi:hypothetical protein
MPSSLEIDVCLTKLVCEEALLTPPRARAPLQEPGQHHVALCQTPESPCLQETSEPSTPSSPTSPYFDSDLHWPISEPAYASPIHGTRRLLVNNKRVYA